MITNNGWIKIHRKIKEKAYYKKSEYVHLWIHLLLEANHEEKEFMWNGQTIKVKPGQLITGRNEIAKKTGIYRSKIERILKYFENEHQIEQQTTNKFRLITILNWEDYQKNEQENEQPVSNKRATSEQQVSTNKNDKNYKNEKNIYIASKNFSPPSLEEVTAYCQERQNGLNPELFLDHYTSNGWLVGKNKMKDWKAAIRTWEKNQSTFNQKPKSGGNGGIRICNDGTKAIMRGGVWVDPDNPFTKIDLNYYPELTK